MSIVNDCKAKEGANYVDADVVINHEVPNSPTQNCLYACLYETLGVVSQYHFEYCEIIAIILKLPYRS